MPENIVKFVDIVEVNETLEINENTESTESQPTPIGSSKRKLASTRTVAEEVELPESTFSEKCMRYIFVVIYIFGLCSLGLFLSIYHLFFWDSRMPPVHKSMITKKPYYIPK